MPNVFPCLNTISNFSITGNILVSLKSKSSLATFSPEAGSCGGDSNQEGVLDCEF